MDLYNKINIYWVKIDHKTSYAFLLFFFLLLIQLNLIIMNKAFRFIKATLKYGLFVGLAVSVSGMSYLQYINSVLGPINISK